MDTHYIGHDRQWTFGVARRHGDGQSPARCLRGDSHCPLTGADASGPHAGRAARTPSASISISNAHPHHELRRGFCGALRDVVFHVALSGAYGLQGRAVIHDRLTLPALLFKGLTEKRFIERPSTIYHLYQPEFGITVTRAHERARAVGVDRASGRILGLAPGTLVMQVRRTALTFGDKPVEYRVSTVNTALHEYVHLLSRPT